MLEAEPGEEACPYEVWVPEPLGTNMVPPTDWIRDLDASEQLEQGIAYSGTTQQVAVVPGRVRARFVVWGYAEDRFVCVSPWVEVNTPPVDFISTSNGDEFTQTEDPVLKARVETVIAAAIIGRDYLRVVARR